VEKGDFSIRDLFRSGDAEVIVQKWLADELERDARGRYSVVRESEVDLAKKPDVRLVHPGVGGPVTIEVKVAESWTFAELEHSLTQQLVEQYLRANNSRHGILFLACINRAYRWKPAPGERIDFTEVVRRLETAAHAIAVSNAGVEQLRVVALDLTRPGASMSDRKKQPGANKTAKKPAAKKAAKKPAAKKPAAKKSVTKKPAAQNRPAKNPVAKEPAANKAAAKKPAPKKPSTKEAAS
jgi:hypothetical protein